MDANRARFHALWGHAGDWGAAAAGDAVEAAGAALRLRGRTPAFGDVAKVRLTPGQRRGAARDKFGNWYWVGPSKREVLVQAAVGGSVSTFWPPPAVDRSGTFAPAKP